MNMRMNKRILTVALALLMVFSMLPLSGVGAGIANAQGSEITVTINRTLYAAGEEYNLITVNVTNLSPDYSIEKIYIFLDNFPQFDANGYPLVDIKDAIVYDDTGAQQGSLSYGVEENQTGYYIAAYTTGTLALQQNWVASIRFNLTTTLKGGVYTLTVYGVHVDSSGNEIYIGEENIVVYVDSANTSYTVQLPNKDPYTGTYYIRPSEVPSPYGGTYYYFNYTLHIASE